MDEPYLHVLDADADVGVESISSKAAKLAIGIAGVLISVADNGKGIPESHITRILEQFFTTRRGHRAIAYAGVVNPEEKVFTDNEL